MSFGNLKSFPGSSMCSHGWEPLFYVASTTVFLKKTTHLSLSLVLQDLYRLSLDHQTKSAWQTPNMPFLTSPESTCPWGSYSKPIHPFIHSFTHSLVCAVVMSTHCVLGTILGAQYTVGNISTGSTLPVLHSGIHLSSSTNHIRISVITK